VSITHDEIIREIERLQSLTRRRPDDSFTSRELAMDLNDGEPPSDHDLRQATRFIRYAMDCGLAEFAGKIILENMTGGKSKVPVYRWKNLQARPKRKSCK